MPLNGAPGHATVIRYNLFVARCKLPEMRGNDRHTDPLVRTGPRTLGLAVFALCRGGPMETKPAQNIQDSFLNTARKDKCVITIYLLSGVKLTGRIRSFDKYSVVLETNNQEQLIFKHAISTVVMSRAHTERHLEARPHAESLTPGVGGNATATVEG
jgi:host factor-I protein